MNKCPKYQDQVDVYYNCCLVGRTLVLPRYSYTSDEAWLSHFETTFPEKAKKMHAYSDKKGWSNPAHIRRWTPVALSWLSKNATPNTK